MRVRAADGVAPEHPGRVEVARVGELARDLRHRVGAARAGHGAPTSQRRASRRSSARPPRARRRGSSGSPVQRQRFPESASRISSSLGSGTRRRRSAAATTKPGVQNPHCTAPASANASCTGWSSPSAPSPSTVTTSWPSACAASTRHEQTSSPSRSTEHEPHSPCSQAFFEPGSSSRSRSVVRRLSPAQTSASRALAVDASARSSREAPLERTPREHAERVAPVRGRAAHVVDRARRRGDLLREGARLVDAATRTSRATGRGRAERGAQLPPLAIDHDRERADGDDHRVPRADLHERLRLPARRDDARRRSARPPRARCASRRRGTRRAGRAACRATLASSTSASLHQQRRERIAGRRRRAEVPADRARGCGSAASRPCATPRRAPAAPRRARRHRLRVRQPGAEPQRPVLARPAAELGDLVEVEDRRRACARSKLSATMTSVPPWIGTASGMLGLAARAPRRATAA